MKKKFFSFLLIMLMSMAGTKALAYDAEIDGIYYNFRGTKAEVTSGNVKYTGTVNIPESVKYNGTTYTVTSIRHEAFISCKGLTSVTIPNSVTSIDRAAFSGCSSLKSFIIPNSVTSIGTDAFDGTPWYYNQPNGLVYVGKVAYKYKGEMPSNTSITIQEGTVSISDYAFTNCSGLTSITIPNSVTSIRYEAFCACYGLTSITVESGNPKYDSRDNCNAIIDSESNGLIVGCNNTIIPNSVKYIYSYAFYGCSSLTSITIPSSVITIGTYAFHGCSGLTSITIPSSVISIGSDAFSGCSRLTSVTVKRRTPVAIESGTFPSRKTRLLVPIGWKATLYVPVGCKAAYEAADYWKDFDEIVE